MTDIDKSLLRNVNVARENMEVAEREARRQRSEYHAAIGDLARSGLTVREIGKAVELSHQRIQQVLDDLVCSFCDLTASEVSKLIAGGGRRRFICDRCAARAALALRTKGDVDEDRVVMEFTATTRDPCEFCGARIGERGDGRKKIDAMATHNHVRICRPCVKKCTDILAGEWKQAQRGLR
jgi:hypothetical protein